MPQYRAVRGNHRGHPRDGHRHDHPESPGRRRTRSTGQMWNELLATFREIAVEQRATGSSSSPARTASSAPAPICQAVAPEGRDRHQLATMRHVGDVALALHRLPQPDDRQGSWRRGRCRLQHGARVRPGGRQHRTPGSPRSSPDEVCRSTSAAAGCCLGVVGLHRAKELALLRRHHRRRRGRAHRSGQPGVADAELDAFVDDWAARLAAGPPIALAMTKRMLNNSMHVTMEEALDDEGAGPDRQLRHRATRRRR